MSEWAVKVGFSKRTANRFFKTLGEYVETGEAPKEWVERCKMLGILNEEGKLVLDEEDPALHLILLGLVWEGVVIQKMADEEVEE